jgi:hypothetical protein
VAPKIKKSLNVSTKKEEDDEKMESADKIEIQGVTEE